MSQQEQRSLRILHVLDTLDPKAGGIVAHVTDLTLLSVRQGLRVRILAPSATPKG